MGHWTYGFDTLNRLTSTQNTATQPPSTQFAGAYGCWTYDGFGNRVEEALSNATSTPCVNGANDNLQLTLTTPTASNQVTNFTYDLAGDVRNDNSNVYYYDVEGRLCAVGFPNGTGGTIYEQYLYDASGTRVGKGTVNSLSCNAPTSGNYTPVLEYLLGPGGEQLTELSVTGSTVNVTHTNFFIGGKVEATYDFNGTSGNGLHFALSDGLGTKRAQVTPSGVGTGTLELQFVTLPFGNSLGNPRVTQSYGSGTDATEQHFTGKERDTESGNDYFGARYYASSMGRFMSPDWSEKPEAVPYADLENPQTLNLYSYMGNNPLSGADPDGHCDWCQKLKNWLSGDGWYTNAQVVDQHRSWLLEHVSTDADAKKVNNATPQQVNDTYACLHSSSCTQQMQDYVAAMKSAAQAAAAAVKFGSNPNQDYHTFRHVEDAGVDKQAAEKAIREDLAGKEDSLPHGLTKGRVNVGGKTLEYNAYKLPDGTINVGRITVH
jgi:RHS repeat-associated protein